MIPESTVVALLDAVGVGVVVLDDAGQDVLSNARARQLRDAEIDEGRRTAQLSEQVWLGEGDERRPSGLQVRTVIDLTATSTAAAGQGPGAGDAFSVLDPSLVQVTEALELSNRRFQALMDTGPLGMAVLDHEARVVRANAQLVQALDREVDELVGRTLAQLAHPDDATVDAEPLAELLAGRIASFERERRFIRRDDAVVWARTVVAAVRDERGDLRHLVLVLHDVTALRRAEQALANRSLHDPLTGLPNRALGIDRIQQALDRTVRTRRRVGVLCCELDRFSVVNDSVGHELGDQVLVEVGRRLQRVLRATDTAARTGGDDFVVVCEDVQDEREAVLVADRILASVREPVEVGGRTLVQTMSIGIAVSSPRADDALTLLRDAGTALHRAKGNGIGTWDVVDEELRARAVERLDVEHDLRAAVQHGDLKLYVQPIVDLSTGRPVGHEALVRWQHPTRGLLTPAWFLPVAEETGLIEEIGRWVLFEATRLAVARPGTGYIAVNVSPAQVMRAGLLADVEAALEASGLPAGRLVVELTESVMLGAAPAGRKELERLDQLGVRLVVDDFGTGFSALSNLRELPVSGIKIDRSFTSGLGEDNSCDRIVEALSGMAHGLGVDLVAEGVETERQRMLLTRLGVVHAQGYLFSRPVPPEQMLARGDDQTPVGSC